MIQTVVAIALFIILLLLVLNSTTDQFLVKNSNAEVEYDLEYSLNSISKAMIHTSSLAQDTTIKVDDFLNVLSVDKPTTLYLKQFYKNGVINTRGLKLDVLNSRIQKNLKIELTMSELDRFTGTQTSELKDASYSFKSNAYTKFTLGEDNLATMHPVVRATGNYVVGLNLSYATEIPKSIDEDYLRIKIPEDKEGGDIIGGVYKAD